MPERTTSDRYPSAQDVPRAAPRTQARYRTVAALLSPTGVQQSPRRAAGTAGSVASDERRSGVSRCCLRRGRSNQAEQGPSISRPPFGSRSTTSPSGCSVAASSRSGQTSSSRSPPGWDGRDAAARALRRQSADLRRPHPRSALRPAGCSRSWPQLPGIPSSEPAHRPTTAARLDRRRCPSSPVSGRARGLAQLHRWC
jgi:hypothetical protein